MAVEAFARRSGKLLKFVQFKGDSKTSFLVPCHLGTPPHFSSSFLVSKPREFQRSATTTQGNDVLSTAKCNNRLPCSARLVYSTQYNDKKVRHFVYSAQYVILKRK